MICDFCYSPDVVCGFDGPETSVIFAGSQGTSTWSQRGGWAACEPCAQLLEQGKLDELATRAVESEGNGLKDEPADKKMLFFVMLRDQYEKISRKREAA